MTISKILAYLTMTLTVILNVVAAVSPFLPAKYQAIATAVLAAFAGTAFLKSHSQEALAAGGYAKVS